MYVFIARHTFAVAGGVIPKTAAAASTGYPNEQVCIWRMLFGVCLAQSVSQRIDGMITDEDSTAVYLRDYLKLTCPNGTAPLNESTRLFTLTRIDGSAFYAIQQVQ